MATTEEEKETGSDEATVTRIIVGRLLLLIPTWLGISLLAFTLSSASPGDPAELILNAQLDDPPTREQLADFRARTGLDDPWVVQYVNFVGDLLSGDMGTSFRTGEPVRTQIFDRVGATLQIAVPAFALSLGLAVACGTIAALRRNRLADHISRTLAMLFESVPTFVLAYVLIIVFSVKLGWFPVAGRGSLKHVVLPVLTLSLASFATMMRLMRSSMLDALGEDHIRTARALGLKPRTVVWRWALKSAVGPVISLAGLVLAGFITGTVIVETVFSWPGVGRYAVDAVFERDYPVVQGFVVFTGTVFLVVNLIVDVLYASLDPRVRLGSRARS